MTKESNVAFYMPIEESAMQAYLQRYPFAVGPDEAMNSRGRAMAAERLALRPERAPVGTKRLTPVEATAPAEVQARLLALMNEAEIPEKARAGYINDFEWEVNLLPAGKKDVLVIGAGDGIELLFLRAAMPDANLTAVDYGDSAKPALKKAVNVRYFVGDMRAILEGMQEKFDLAFSNHTLEHLYLPDHILGVVSGLLREDGALVSTFPMDAIEGTPFIPEMLEIVKQKTVHPVDFVMIDSGHPWKTNPGDVDATFQGAGFKKVEMYQREQHLGRYFAGNEEELRKEAAEHLQKNARVFGTLRRIVKMIFPKNPPTLVTRMVFAAERRTSYGVNGIKNRYAQEVCVVAYK